METSFEILKNILIDIVDFITSSEMIGYYMTYLILWLLISILKVIRGEVR